MLDNKKVMELLGLFALCVALFLIVSLLTYHPTDPPAGVSDQISNLGGEVGAAVSAYLRWGFGRVSWLLVFALLVFSIQTFRHSLRPYSWFSLLGWVLSIMGISGLVALFYAEAGGLVGLYLVDKFTPRVGEAGSLLFFSFVLVLGFSLHTARSISEAAVEFVKLAGNSGTIFREQLLRLKEKIKNWLPAEKKEPQSSSSSQPPSEHSSSSFSQERSSAAEKKDSKEDFGSKSTPSESSTVIPITKNKKNEDSEQKVEQGANGSKPVEVKQKRPSVDRADMSRYRFPGLDLLEKGNIEQATPDADTIQKVSKKLEKTFEEFGINARVVNATPGPVLTMYEVEPGPGVSVNKIQSRADDIKLSLAVKSLRIVSPIPGKSAVGIEVPNPSRAIVKLRDVIATETFQDDSLALPVAIGLNVFGDPLVVDLNKLPHLLVAGATGSGKSVCINAIICSLLYRLPPDRLKFILVDPKRVELKLYEGLPHLMLEVIDDPSDANKALKWAVKEMESRYETLSEAGNRDIASYNKNADPDDRLPYMVIIVDELADLMFTNPKECEQSITRLAQMARAVGIHMVLATQRPSTDVITGLIKANMPARLSFRVSSGTDSRVVIDQNGAETLMGSGDLLYLSSSSPHPRRAQGAFLNDEETKNLIRFVKEQLRPSYLDEDEVFGSTTGLGFEGDFDDKYYEDAKELVVRTGKASASMIQRRFRVGYNRAARMVDMMQEEGIVGPHRGSKARKVLVDKDEYLEENND
ncbi:MAG: DNA translocase FtsK [bacterium]